MFLEIFPEVGNIGKFGHTRRSLRKSSH
jgi:hypothetical protein